MGESGFWDDQGRAAKVSAEHSRTRRRLDEFRSLERDVADLSELEQMAAEDDSIATEVEAQRASIESRLATLEEARLFAGDYDAGDAVITINAGAGGTDSQDWAEMLLRTYTRWFDRSGFKHQIVELTAGEEAGVKSATITVEGRHAYGLLSTERGVHRLVRISPFDSAKRRHTSFASVDATPEIEDDFDVEVNPDELRIDTYRSSGAGGQHVNVTDSAVRITHLPTNIVVAVQNERSQMQNRDVAMRILKSRLVARAREEREAEVAAIRGEQRDIGFGSQIRSYVLHPYQMVKDHRTLLERGNVQAVLDGDLDSFIQAELRRRAGAAED